MRFLKSSETSIISEIAEWCFNEWETPKEKTIKRLQSLPSDNVLAQVIVEIEDKLVSTGSLCLDPNIFNSHPHLKQYNPWITMLITDVNQRRNGIGADVLNGLERAARTSGYKSVYLATATAESLYQKCGYHTFDTVFYKGFDTVIMKKII